MGPVKFRNAANRRGRIPAAASLGFRLPFAPRFARLREAGERGSILVLSVLSALIIVGSAGLAVDVGRLYATKAELSRAVDAAALSGVLEFNGQVSGLNNAKTKAEAYMVMNEPTIVASCSSAVASRACVVPDGSTSTLRINAVKSTRLFFLPIFGISTASVSAKAISGFNDQTLDAVMVIDSTYSMSGAPLTNAKTAAIAFKDTLLGTNGSGNVKVGLAPLRGCYRDDPMPSSKTDCIDNATQVWPLTYDSPLLSTKINALTAGTVSATNICTGLGKGYEVLRASVNWAASNHRRFMVLLSDGDNVYFGDYTYQASPPSPTSYTIPLGGGGTSYPCQPPNTCTGWGLYCFTGTYVPPGTAFATEGFESNNWSGGAGWSGAWTTSGTDVAIIDGSTTPTDSGTYQARLRGNGTITRIVDLSSYASAALLYKVKTSSLESGDNTILEISHDNSSWTTLRDHAANVSSYTEYTANLDPYVGDSTVYIRFRGSMGDISDNFYVDSIAITNDSSIGYLNGQDGQNYTSCSETPGARERQVDVETLNIANAIKAQNIEIFVVAFSACANSDGNTLHTSACASQANPVSSPPLSGKVGDTTTETTANTRLAKCIASSTPGTNDHFFYATNAALLPNIFTTIAAQIAHRLVE